MPAKTAPRQRIRIVREQPRRGLSDEAFERVFGKLVEYFDRFDLLDGEGGFLTPHLQHFSHHTGGQTLGNVLATAEKRGLLRIVGARCVFS